MKSEIQFGHFSISFPDFTFNTFTIFEDLADFFGVDYQSDAVKILKKELNQLELKPKPSIDFESDNTQIESRSAETIFKVANLIMDLTIPEKQIKLTNTDSNDIFQSLKSWKRPAKQKWNAGDVFSIPLKNNTYCFGQIIGTHITKRSPICALFELNNKNDKTNFDELSNCRVLSVWNYDSEELDNHTFKIIFDCELITKPEKVKDSNVSGGASFQTLANIFFGLEPWNVMFKDDYYDKFFQEGIEKPKNIIWLNEKERIKYRREKFNIDENNQRIKCRVGKGDSHP